MFWFGLRGGMSNGRGDGMGAVDGVGAPFGGRSKLGRVTKGGKGPGYVV